MKDELTHRQKEVFDYIKQTISDRGYPPSIRDICIALDMNSTSTAKGHLDILEEKGYIRRDPLKPRAIEIVSDTIHHKVARVPLIGTVTAGMPILAVENIEEYIPFPIRELRGYEECFCLKVRGDSMINANIYEGDIILVGQQDCADNGDIVVALVDDSATVKRFYKEDGHYRLQPENPSMSPIIVNDVKILGKVIGLIRML